MAKITIELSDKEYEDFKELLETLSAELRQFRLRTEEEYVQSSKERAAEKQKRDEENRKYREAIEKSKAETKRILDELESRVFHK